VPAETRGRGESAGARRHPRRGHARFVSRLAPDPPRRRTRAPAGHSAHTRRSIVAPADDLQPKCGRKGLVGRLPRWGRAARPALHRAACGSPAPPGAGSIAPMGRTPSGSG